MKRAFFGSLMPMSRRIAGTNAIRACEENRGRTGEFPFFRLRTSLTGKKGIHQSDPDFLPCLEAEKARRRRSRRKRRKRRKGKERQRGDPPLRRPPSLRVGRNKILNAADYRLGCLLRRN